MNELIICFEPRIKLIIALVTSLPAPLIPRFHVFQPVQELLFGPCKQNLFSFFVFA